MTSQVYYRREHGLNTAEEQGEQPEQSLLFSGNRSEGRLPGLQPYSVYNISIRVLNSKGEGPASQTRTFKTPEGGMCTRLQAWRRSSGVAVQDGLGCCRSGRGFAKVQLGSAKFLHLRSGDTIVSLLLPVTDCSPVFSFILVFEPWHIFYTLKVGRYQQYCKQFYNS